MEIEPQTFEMDVSAIERAKEELRRTWRYEEVDHIPIMIDLSPECGETVRDAHTITRAWFSSAVRRIKWSLEALPDDYIPLVEPPWLAYHTIEALFGVPLWWADDPNAFPGIKKAPVTDVSGLYELPKPDPYLNPFMVEILHRLEIANVCFSDEVSIGGVDMMSPLGDVQELMDQTLFFVSLKRHPEAIHHACEVVTEAQIAIQDAALSVVGNQDRFASMGNWPAWRPEFAKVLVADDVAGLLSPKVFQEYDMPYSNRLINRYGGGLLHVCGPNHSAHLYMHDDPPTYGLNCSFRYSYENFPMLREELGPTAEAKLGRRGHLEVMWERGVPLNEMVRGFRDLVDQLAPDVVAIPYCQVLTDGSVTNEEITEFYWSMRAISEDYAKRMRWRV